MVYEIVLESVGEITLLPDSQKLFGFLISKLSESFTDEETSDFVKQVYENKIICMISNLFPKGYIPLPKAYILDRISDDLKEIYNLIKKMEYIDEKSFKFIINSIETTDKNIKSMKNLKDEIEKNVSFIYVKNRYSQKFKLESQEKSLPGLPNKSYSLPILEYYRNNNFEKYDIFSFLVQVDENSILSSYIEELYNNVDNEIDEVYGLGSKVSHGYNTYRLKQVKKHQNEENLKNSIYINMGMLIPQIEKINPENSYLDIYSSNRKSYEISDSIEKVISFIKPGSIINPKNRDFINIGRCIINEYNIVHKNAIIFGNSFIKKLEVSNEI